MFKVSELAMPKTRRVNTVCNGRKEVWEDREKAQDFFPQADDDYRGRGT